MINYLATLDKQLRGSEHRARHHFDNAPLRRDDRSEDFADAYMKSTSLLLTEEEQFEEFDRICQSAKETFDIDLSPTSDESFAPH